MPKVSVIMNCLNGEDYLREAIDSVFAQSETDWELVFLDNASTDRSGEIARSYGEKVKYFWNDETIPLGAARNQAVALAAGEYVAFLDADDVWKPEKLGRQLALMDAKPTMGLTFTNATIYHQYDGTANTAFQGLGQLPPRGRMFGYLLMNQIITMSTVVVRREALANQPEIFDPRYTWAPEYDLFLRIAYEWECDYIDEPMALYRVHKASTSERLYSRRPIELRMTLEKLLDRYPLMLKEYPEAVAANRRIIAIEQGKASWREGKIGEARAAFAQYIPSPLYTAAWLATLVPYSWVIKTWQLVSRMRRVRYGADG
ncbi:MAG: glycosyltransferase family 2 protein [Solirubrobacterales bacterium]